MVLNINHEINDLHGALGISDERMAELKEGFKGLVENCLNNGIAKLDTLSDEDGFNLHISQSNVIEKLAFLADNEEELTLCIAYVDTVIEKVENFCKLEAFKQKFGEKVLKEKLSELEGEQD